jgi:Retrotransposon gag protein
VKTNDTQYFYPNTENANAMTNGADETLNQLDTNMLGLGIEPSPTPDPPTQWGPEQFVELRTQMIQLEQKTDWVYHELEKTKVQLEKTRTELATARGESTTVRTASGKGEAKGADPPLFTGNQRELETWITACRLRFAGQPSKFDTEEKKVVHATSFMRGPPLAWFQPVINAYSTAEHDDELPPEFQSFETFVQSIRVLYGDPDLQRNSERMILHLKQGDGTVAEYTSRFAIHSQYTKFDDDSLTGHFYEGLHGDIKDELAVREWKDLKGLQVLAGRLDARLRQRKKEKEWEEKAAKPKSNPWANTPP